LKIALDKFALLGERKEIGINFNEHICATFYIGTDQKSITSRYLNLAKNSIFRSSFVQELRKFDFK
jgi:hypothetical protein